MILSPVLTNGQEVFSITGGILGQAAIVFACASYPSAGTVTLEYQPAGGTNWILATGDNGQTSTQSATAQAAWSFYGAVSQIRLTFASLSGGSGALLAVSQESSLGFPVGAFSGLRALTTQDYTEANVKNGTEFETSNFSSTVAANGTLNGIFITGSLPVIIKSRQIQTNATLASYNVFQSPTSSNVAQIPIYNLNGNPAIAKATTCQAWVPLSVSATGTQVAATTYFLGSAPSNTGAYAANAERVLLPNTTYLTQFTNLGATGCAVGIYFSWYEGFTDLPLS